MTTVLTAEKWAFPGPARRLNIIVGGFGSGKTEISVNLAMGAARRGLKVVLADLDIANPYFRSREAQISLRAAGVEPVYPDGEQQFSDLPIIGPRILGLVQGGTEDLALFDVGGDEQGARVLASLGNSLGAGPYGLWMVINGRRPFTNSLERCMDMKNTLERASSLKVSGFLLNTHLIDETTAPVVLAGVTLGEQVAAATGVPVVAVCVMGDELAQTVAGQVNAPVWAMAREMRPPWLPVAGPRWPQLDRRV